MRVALCLAALLLAGCVGAPAAPPQPAADDDGRVDPRWDALRGSLADLPCPSAPGEAASLRVLAEHALDDPVPTDYAEMAFTKRGDATLLVVARIGEGAVNVLLVENGGVARTHVWALPERDAALDVKFASDGATLLLAGNDAIHLVDMRDPWAPVVESVHPLDEPSAHLLTVFRTEQGEFVAASKGEGKDVSIFEVVGDAGTRTLERRAQPHLTPLGAAPRSGGLMEIVRSHDTWFAQDEALDLPILWVANVWWGIVLLDVSDASAPRVLATIPETDPFLGYTHSVQATFIDGRRIVAATTEYGTGALKVYDATDLASPRLLATWTLDAPTKPLHNLQVVDEKVILAALDGGLLVFDLRHALGSDHRLALRPIAHLPPAGAPESPRLPLSLGQAYFGPRDVVVIDGLLHVSEATAGLRTVAFGCFPAGDGAFTSTG